MNRITLNLIFVSIENWDEIWRRNQFLCSGLAERCPDTKILFVGPPHDVSHILRRGEFRTLRHKAAWTLTEHPNITVMRPLKLFPNTLTFGRRFNEVHARVQIHRAAARLGLHHPLLWLNPHTAVHMAGRMGESAVVYDITDDWVSLTQGDRLRRLTISQDTALCRRADAVIVCSSRLFNLKRPLAHNLHLIPNGVNAAHYRTVSDAGLLPAAAAQWPRPVLGYTGSLHPDRVDVTLVESLARAFPSGTVALIGPNMLLPQDEARLRALGNVSLPGPIAYKHLPDYMRAFDVCITPHVMTPFTESLNPIKLWEYLASGKPIVSTDVAGFRDYPQFVHLAADPDAFVAACRIALQEAANPSARIAEATRHSWHSRIDAILAVLKPLIPSVSIERERQSSCPV